MQKLRKLLPLWVALGILLVVGGLVFGLDRVQTTQEHAKAAPVFIPLSDGAWKLHPSFEPELIYRWQSEEHFMVEARGILFLFDNDSVYIYDISEDSLTLFQEDLLIDYSLGPKGVFIDIQTDRKAIFDLYYVVRGSQRWESVDWCDQRISVCTRAKISSFGDVYSLEIIHDPEQPFEQSLNETMPGVALREDGQRCIITNSIPHITQRKSPWFEAKQDNEIHLRIGTHNFTIGRVIGNSYIAETYTMLNNDTLSEPDIDTTEWTMPRLKYPHLFVEDSLWYSPDFFYRTPLGSLYYSTWRRSRVALFSDVSEAQFEASRVWGRALLIPTDNGTRVYSKFGKDWVRFDIPAEIE